MYHDRSIAKSNSVLDELDSMAASIGSTYPELELGQNSAYAARCAELDPVRAQTYFDRAMAYYRTHYEERSQLADLPIPEWGDFDWVLDRDRSLIVADRYERLGFPRLAYKYRKVHYFEPEW